jgi:AraC-like DNA-binding protein
VHRNALDEPKRVLEIIERVPVHPMAEMMLVELAEVVRGLPIGVARAIEQLFRSPHAVGNSQELAERAGVSARSLYRYLNPAGLQPRNLIVCARLLRAYTLLREPGSRLKEVTAKLGYADPDTLSHLLQSWTGYSVKEIRTAVAPREFVRLLAEHMRQEVIEV